MHFSRPFSAFLFYQKQLAEFTGNRELVLQANNAAQLTKMIKWASTTASIVSAPSSRVAGSPVDQLLAQDNIGKAAGSGPLILDMNNIPNPDDATDGDVW